MITKNMKKDLRQKLEESIKNTFSNFNGAIGPKKHRRNIKKATKLLLSNVKVTPEKKQKEKINLVEQVN